MNYIGFKDTVGERQGKKRASIYFDVWSTLHDLQAGESRLEREERAISGIL
jgi:hypothetical protein